MKVGVVPYYAELFDDKLFEYDGYELGSLYGVDRLGFKELRARFERVGHEIHTVDRYGSYDEMDLCILIDIHWGILNELMKRNDGPKRVYMMRESPAHIQFNSSANVKLFSRFFDAVLSWNDILTASSTDFYEYKLPYLQPGRDLVGKPFKDRNLLVNITGNKHSTHPEELYSNRREVVEYYGEHHPDAFSLYGRGWNRTSVRDRFRPRKTVSVNSVYKGEIERKESAYHRHRYALCFENVTNVRGYVTEKLFDCFRAGIVPVYWGADNITEYVPEDCFIDYRQFSGPVDLHEHLTAIEEEEFEHYLDSARSFLNEDGQRFRAEHFAERIHEALMDIHKSDTTSADSFPAWLREDLESRVLADQIDFERIKISTLDNVRNVWGIARRNPALLQENPSLVTRLLPR